jgi:hypothetical protein
MPGPVGTGPINEVPPGLRAIPLFVHSQLGPPGGSTAESKLIFATMQVGAAVTIKPVM